VSLPAFCLECSNRNLTFLKQRCNDSPVFLSVIVNKQDKHYLYCAGRIMAISPDGASAYMMHVGPHIIRVGRLKSWEHWRNLIAQQRIAIRHTLMVICREYRLNYLFINQPISWDLENEAFLDASLVMKEGGNKQ
jgi:hypothetical protein